MVLPRSSGLVEGQGPRAWCEGAGPRPGPGQWRRSMGGRSLGPWGPLVLPVFFWPGTKDTRLTGRLRRKGSCMKTRIRCGPVTLVVLAQIYVLVEVVAG